MKLLLNNATIINQGKLVNIPSLNVSSWKRRDNDTFTILENSILTNKNLLLNATIIPWQIISELDEVQQLGESQIRIRNLGTNSIFNLRSAIVSLEQRVLFYEGIIANLLTPEKEALISEDGVQQIQLGNTTAIYQCQKVIEFTPIFTRKTNNECFNDIPIVLPGTQDLPFTQCVWPKDVPLFLVQFMKYTYNKSADIMTKNNLANEYRKVILSLNSTTT